jgi:hypothetical protein
MCKSAVAVEQAMQFVLGWQCAKWSAPYGNNLIESARMLIYDTMPPLPSYIAQSKAGRVVLLFVIKGREKEAAALFPLQISSVRERIIFTRVLPPRNDMVSSHRT